MFSGFERFVAFRYLKSKRKEVFISIITIISVISVAVSVMVLDVVLSVMTGFEAELRDKLLGASAHIIVRSASGAIPSWEKLEEPIRSVPGVLEVYPYTYSQAMLSSALGSQGVLIRGVSDYREPKAKLEEVLTEDAKIDQLFAPVDIEVVRPDGTPDLVKLPPIIIGQSLQQKLNLSPGTPVTLFSPELSNGPQGLMPKVRRFVVVGGYSSGLVEYENGLAYVSMKDAQSFFGFGSAVTGLEIKVQDLFQAKAIATKIIQALSDIPLPLYATDWTEPNKPLWEAMKLEKRVYFIVLLLLILVASFSIVSTLVMVVMEKNKDIAVLKTMGASDRSILRIFLLQGTMIGALGTVLGTILGVVVSVGLREYGFELDEKVFSLSQVPVHLVPSNFALVAVAGFFMTALAGIYPARRAARINPADLLRHE